MTDRNKPYKDPKTGKYVLPLTIEEFCKKHGIERPDIDEDSIWRDKGLWLFAGTGMTVLGVLYLVAKLNGA